MGLGATLKVAMDTKAVKKGLDKIKGMFAKLGKLTSLGGLKDMLLSIPGGGAIVALGALTVGTAKWVKELKAMSNQTGVAVGVVLQLRQAFKLSGTEVSDQADLLSDLQEKVEDAARGGGTGGEGYPFFGLNARQLQKIQDPLKQLEAVMNAVERKQATHQKRAYHLDKIYGGVGFKMVHLADNWSHFMKQGADDTKTLAATLDESLIAQLGEVMAVLSRLQLMFRTVSLNILRMLPIDQINEMLNGAMRGVNKFLAPAHGKAGDEDYSAGPLKTLKNTWSWLKNEFVALWQKLVAMLSAAFDAAVAKFSAVFPKVPEFIKDPIGRLLNTLGLSEKGASPSKRTMPAGGSGLFPGVGPLSNIDRTLMRMERQRGATWA